MIKGDSVKKYVLAGCSGRALAMFAKPMQKKFSDSADLVGIFDPNDVRMEYFNTQLETPTAMYTNFRKMLKEQNPDTLIVATTDRWHHKYIIAGLNAGLDIITEKPMTIDMAKCKAIMAAEKKSGKKVSVTFNLRHAPYYNKIKKLLRSGVVGEVLSVKLEWFLDTSHGADYFRRWHARKDNSGGLLVHKSTHHFDFINWLIEDDPTDVFAYGSRRVYGDCVKMRGKTCRSCRHKKT
jgi:predicted dehydrogenase